MIDRDLVPLVADLMMAAAYADDRLRGGEAIEIKRRLAELLGEERVPSELERRLAHFDPARFDLEAAARPLAALSPESAREVLELVAAVHAADGELDLDEDGYLERLGSALGLPRSAYEDLLLEAEAVTTRSKGPSRPPPVPES